MHHSYSEVALPGFPEVACMSNEGTPLKLVFGVHGDVDAIAHCDAGTRKGFVTLGAVIREQDEVIGIVMEPCLDTTNTTEAELFAVLRTLEEALSLEVKALSLFTDCESVLAHVANPLYKTFRYPAQRIRDLAQKFTTLVIHATPRSQNTEADALARSARAVYRPDLVYAASM
jgi:ribonuclease HI